MVKSQTIFVYVISTFLFLPSTQKQNSLVESMIIITPHSWQPSYQTCGQAWVNYSGLFTFQPSPIQPI